MKEIIAKLRLRRLGVVLAGHLGDGVVLMSDVDRAILDGKQDAVEVTK